MCHLLKFTCRHYLNICLFRCVRKVNFHGVHYFVTWIYWNIRPIGSKTTLGGHIWAFCALQENHTGNVQLDDQTLPYTRLHFLLCIVQPLYRSACLCLDCVRSCANACAANATLCYFYIHLCVLTGLPALCVRPEKKSSVDVTAGFHTK